LEDLWGQTWFLDAGQRLGRTFSAFRDRWFRPIKVGQFNRWVPTEWAQEEIQQRLSDICLTLDPKDWFDMRDPIVNVVYVDLPASAKVKYRELERELFTMIGSTEIEVMNAAARSMKCLQLANGAAYVDPERYGEGAWVEVHGEKLDALEELADETGGDPLLVIYQFRSDLARLLKRFPEAWTCRARITSRRPRPAKANSGLVTRPAWATASTGCKSTAIPSCSSPRTGI
jgi:hypothetical protein